LPIGDGWQGGCLGEASSAMADIATVLTPTEDWGFDEGIVAKIRDLGEPPFLLVRNAAAASPAEAYLVCQNQNQAPQFVADAVALPAFGESRLLRAVERALQLDVVNAATLLVSWAKGEGPIAETLYVGRHEGRGPRRFSGYPAFGVSVAGPATVRARVALLTAALEAYDAIGGNGALRPPLAEALAFALSRARGGIGDYGEAARVVEIGLAASPGSIYLLTAKRALRATLGGGEIAAGLARFIGEDDGAFAIALKLQEAGFQPFVLVRNGAAAAPGTGYIICATQNDAAQFAADLARLPGFAEGRLLRGIEAALGLEPLAAAELLVSWIRGEGAAAETAFVALGDEFPPISEYPVYAIGVPPPASARERAALLAATLAAYAATQGNDGLRFALIEALAVALCRAFASLGDHGEAARIVRIASTICPPSPYLAAAQGALAAKLANREVPARLAGFIGENDAHLAVIAKIRGLGFQPFFLVSCGPAGSSAASYLIGRDQNDAERFAESLAVLPGFADSRLLRGIERALRLETLAAADLLYAWVKADGPLPETVLVDTGLSPFIEYPAFAMSTAGPAGFRRRAELLAAAFDAYGNASGNDGIRFVLLEALALALSRAFGSIGDDAEASRIVGLAVAISGPSPYLQAARYALEARLVGLQVPARLAGFIGEDNGHLAIIAKVRELGFQPFILVCNAPIGSPAQADTVCRNQNDVAAFVDALARLPLFAESRLLRGIERALQLEVFDAADLLFSWVKGEGKLAETVIVGTGDGTGVPAFVEYPAFAITVDAPASFRERAALLATACEAYSNAPGNDALRFMLIEALAFALSRAFGSIGDYAEASRIVGIGLAARPYSIYLKAASYALTAKLEGSEVPARLVKFIGEDNGYLKQFVCPEPFDRFDISPDGGVLVCCGHWLPTNIGNFLNEPVENILNSAMAQKIRQSVTDGTYKYCNHLECGTMIAGLLPTRAELPPGRASHAVASGDYRVDGVDNVLFAFDQTCNLSCPSCRRARIVERVSDSEEKAQAVEEKLLPLLPALKVLNLNPAGELFASKPSRKLLELINDERCPDLALDIISNGTLFTEEEWNKFPGIHNKVRSIRVSVDAARKETFEQLRRLGKHDIFVENMRFLSRLRATNIVPELKFSFTYQLDNFREMREFVEFAASMNCDYVIFERLQNLGAFTHDEFRQRAVHHVSHPLYSEFIDVIKDPIFRGKNVWHDFDYPGVVNMSREDAWDRFRDMVAARLAHLTGAAAGVERG
jgi:hypothetical protein